MKRYLPLVLFGLAFGERVLFDLGPNMELVTMAMVVASVYLGSRMSMWLVLSVMVLSDLVLGNSMIFVFTWSGFLIPALLMGEVIKGEKMLSGTVAGLGANLFFFLWTNFGVWALGGLYPMSWGGLVSSYINAIPFLKAQVVSTILFVPSALMAVEMVSGLVGKRLSWLVVWDRMDS